MKRAIKILMLAIPGFIMSFVFISMCFAQTSPIVAGSPVPSTPAVMAIVPASAPGGIMNWINSAGGFQAAVLLLVTTFMAILSAIRTLFASFDGVAPGAAIPTSLSGLTLINKICVIGGQILDFIQGNVQH